MAGPDEATVVEVKTAVDALRVATEKYGTDSAELKDMFDKTKEAIEKDEKSHQALVAVNAESEKKTLALEERIQDFELEIAKAKTVGVKISYKDSEEYKSLEFMCMKGVRELSPDQVKTMRMDDSTAGGYLTTTEMDNMIIKSITEISPVRQVARVKTVGKKTLDIPKRTAIPTAEYEGEAEQNDESQSVYGNETLTTYRLSTTVPYTMDLLGDSIFDLESEIQNDVVEAFSFKEGNKFVLGTGSKQPEGFLINAEVAANFRLSETAGTITGDDMILLTGDLKVGYNPMYGFNRQTLAFLRTLKGSDGQYLWQNGLAPNAPNTLNGEPYIVIQDMPIIANNSLSVVYADFLRGYTITDRTGMVIIRDEVTGARQAIIKLTFHRWNTGQVVLGEAFRLLKTKST